MLTVSLYFIRTYLAVGLYSCIKIHLQARHLSQYTVQYLSTYVSLHAVKILRLHDSSLMRYLIIVLQFALDTKKISLGRAYSRIVSIIRLSYDYTIARTFKIPSIGLSSQKYNFN